jgi:hypothetical protein
VRTWIRREGSGAVLESGDATAAFAVAGSPFNRAVGFAIGGPVDPAELDRVEAFYATHGVAPRVDLCPHSHPSLLTELRERGYVPEQWTSVWWRSGAVPLPAPSADASVTRVESREHPSWVAVVAEGFRGHPSGDRDPIAETAPFVPGVRLYLARVGDEVAGGASLAIDGGIAILGGAATRPSLRRRGVHRALLSARLRDAAGCEAATLHTRPGAPSEGNAVRAGFRLAYTKLTLLGRFR